MAEYKKVRITGQLIVKTELHIGTGISEAMADPQQAGSILSVLSDSDGNPYICASTLRGSLNAAAAIRLQSSLPEGTVKRLFGYARDDAAFRGRLTVFNARLASSNTHRVTEVRSQASLTPSTRTAQDHHLYRLTFVTPGTAFDCEFMLDDTNDEEIRNLLALLQCWDATMQSSLGGMVSKGFGCVEWAHLGTRVLSSSRIEAWLEDELPDDADQRLDSAYEDVHEKFKADADRKDAHAGLWAYEITTTDPILINDPEFVSRQSDPDYPQLACLRTPDGNALIPGSTLKGAARAHSRRILMTMLMTHHGCAPRSRAAGITDALLDRLFGHEKAAGYLQFSNAVSTEPLRRHRRPLIAIDRFSGGVKGGDHRSRKQREAHEDDRVGGALVFTEAALNNRYKASVTTHRTVAAPAGDWWKGLLVFLLRDVMEGDLSLGWGRARGFGSVRLTFNQDDREQTDWCMVSEKVGSATLSECTDALHDELAALCAESEEK